MPYSPEGGASLLRLKLFAILMICPVSIKIDRHTLGRIVGPHDEEIGSIKPKSSHV